MSQCVPSWDLDDATPSSRLPLRSRSSNSNNIAPDVPLLDYEVAELTWENGQIAMHGLGPPRVPTNANKNLLSNAGGGACKYAQPHWDKPRAGGTLESIVNQATRPPSSLPPPPKLAPSCGPPDEIMQWYGRAASTAAGVSNVAAAPGCRSGSANMDARVPCGGEGSYTQVASCSGAAAGNKRAASARVPGSAACGSGSNRVRLESLGGERDCGGEVGMTSSMGSPENASSGNPSTKTATATAADDHDSVCHSRLQRESGDEEEEEDKKKGKSSVSTKRSRAAAIHNQSERKRRDKINQRMKTLQKLVPNSSKTDKASMLDEVIDYLKQLQAQVQMMSRMNMPAMMLPVAMQQQLHQLSMMGSMGMGMGMGMGLDLNSMARPNLTAMPQPVLHPNPFMPMASWDGAAADGRMLQPQLAAVLQDPLSTFFACQSQPMTTEAYSRMAAMYQQLHQPPASSSKT